MVMKQDALLISRLIKPRISIAGAGIPTILIEQKKSQKTQEEKNGAPGPFQKKPRKFLQWICRNHMPRFPVFTPHYSFFYFMDYMGTCAPVTKKNYLKIPHPHKNKSLQNFFFRICPFRFFREY